MTNEERDDLFTSATAFAAEGARVGLVTCRVCGAAVLIDPREAFSATHKHADWHEEQHTGLGDVVSQ